jgi:hypothetical protein
LAIRVTKSGLSGARLLGGTLHAGDELWIVEHDSWPSVMIVPSPEPVLLA